MAFSSVFRPKLKEPKLVEMPEVDVVDAPADELSAGLLGWIPNLGTLDESNAVNGLLDSLCAAAGGVPGGGVAFAMSSSRAFCAAA